MADLPRWSDVLAHLDRGYARASRSVHAFQLPHAGGTLMLLVDLATFHSGSSWLGLTVPICPADRLHLRGALVANSELPIGALAVHGGNVSLRQTVPLDGLTSDVLDPAITALGAVAARLQAAARVPDARSDQVPFAYCFRSTDSIRP